jgi:small conductance mechanosensitive channel
LKNHLFQTRTHSWQEVGLARQLSRGAVKRARVKAAVLLPLLLAILAIYQHRRELFGPEWDDVVSVLTAAALVVIGWGLARDIGRAFGPTLFRHLEPGTAGSVGFLIRLMTLIVVAILALRIAGFSPHTLALSGAVTAVLVGLAAQQTLGNMFAGTLLISARPFRVGERIQLQGGGLAGTIDGVVSSLGLLYTVLARGESPILIPNAIVLNAAVVPIKEPNSVELRARLASGVTPADLEETLENSIETPIRNHPRITLEELDGDQVVVRISATPRDPGDARTLAGEVLEAVAAQAAGTQSGANDGDHAVVDP